MFHVLPFPALQERKVGNGEKLPRPFLTPAKRTRITIWLLGTRCNSGIVVECMWGSTHADE
eukprot:8986908-Pyramimonas_sp.AAC.1